MSNDEKNTPNGVQSPGARKKTQKLLAWGIFGVVMVVAIASVFFFEPPPSSSGLPQQQPTKATQTSITAPGGVSAQNVWVDKAATDLNQLSQLSTGQKSLLERMAKLEQGGGSAGQTQPRSEPAVELKPLMNFDRPPPIVPPAPPVVSQLPPAPPEQTPNSGLPVPASAKFAGGIQGISVGYMGDAGAVTPASPAVTGAHAAPSKLGKSSGADEEGDDVTNYIPAGSFARVTMLGGMDAPTGGQAQTNPQPVLLRVDGDAILPNKYKYQIKECLVVASGYGDIASERAYIRTESISCILDNGETIETAIKGYVAGEDGKTGLRGRLVTKQGQLLANALYAGIGAGLGQAFQQSATTQSVSALGSTQTVNSGQQLQAGVSTGVGRALDRLANYYIQLAEKTFPVIEVDAGRTVDLILTKGVSFKTKKNDKGRSTTLRDVAEEGRNVGRSLEARGYFD